MCISTGPLTGNACSHGVKWFRSSWHCCIEETPLCHLFVSSSFLTRAVRVGNGMFRKISIRFSDMLDQTICWFFSKASSKIMILFRVYWHLRFQNGHTWSYVFMIIKILDHLFSNYKLFVSSCSTVMSSTQNLDKITLPLQYSIKNQKHDFLHLRFF